MSAALRWEDEPELPGVIESGSRVLVCRACGAILKRKTGGRVVLVLGGEHMPGCPARRAMAGQEELFA